MKEEVQFAKRHIRNRFSFMVLPHISTGIWSVYDNAKDVCEKNRQLDQILKTFQNLLTRIPVWTEDTLNAEVSRITIASKCSYLEELLTGVLLTYLRAFAAVQYRSTTDSIEVEFERPPLPKFIHELYKEVARRSWEHAYLFKTIGVSSEQQARNRKDIDTIIETAIDTVLDSFLPWQSIVNTYFSAPDASIPATPDVIQPVEVETERKGVSFSESVEDNEESDDEEGPRLMLSDEIVTLDVPTLDDAPQEEEVLLDVKDDPLVLKI
jgi:hypothetical protein